LCHSREVQPAASTIAAAAASRELKIP